MRCSERSRERGVVDTISYAIINGMTSTITIDAAGRLVLPKSIREKLSLRAGSKLDVVLVADKVELIPHAEDVRIEKKQGRLVVAGVPEPFDAVAAVKAVREERDDRVARRVRGR